MKKKLMLAVMLLTVGVATNVKAEETGADPGQDHIKFELDGEQPKIYDEDSGTYISIDPFYTGDDELTIRMPQGWSVRLYRQNENETGYGTLVDMDYLCQEVTLYREYPSDRAPYDVKEARLKDGYRLNYQGGTYKLPLWKPSTEQEKEEKKKYYEKLREKNHKLDTCPSKKDRQKVALHKGEKLTFVFGDDGNWEAGTLVYKDSETIKSDKAKDEKETRQKEQEAQTLQSEDRAPESTDQVSENETETQNKFNTELNGRERESTTNIQSHESIQDQTEESSWTTHFISSVKSAWEAVKHWFRSWWKG
ncbi:TPA: hypothetical protein ACJ68J_000820 [Streptococcus pyogenes]